MNRVKQILDRFYDEYNFEERLLCDPIAFPHRYKNPGDVEASGLIAASFAYGRVELFRQAVEKILSLMGKSPQDFLINFDARRHRKLFSGIKYRFNENEDVICLMHVFSRILKTQKSVEKAFKSFYKEDDPDIGNALKGFVDYCLSIDTSVVYGKDIKPNGFAQFLPSPSKGSACKRMNLFLRWMIRDKDIDFGIWKGIPKNKLIVPLDTHIGRISRCLGFTDRKSDDWKTAVEITNALKRLDPEDPLKYDFAMCHHGIAGFCKSGDSAGNAVCRKCTLVA